MKNKLRISETATEQLTFLSNRLDLKRNIICRLAVAESLTVDEPVENYSLKDRKGLEFNRPTLTGDQDLIFKTLIIQHEKKQIDDDTFFSKYFRNHIERGIDMLYKDYQKVNSPINFLMKLAELK
ncbi:MAG: DNA sulfur modification protein DndE [Candidatus Thermoplasmatota archaeon]|nr:DNA sulfur modification protein DndE [Candidatus Thermoplasmatota archaeon]